MIYICISAEDYKLNSIEMLFICSVLLLILYPWPQAVKGKH